MTFSNARSKSFGSSYAPTSRAISLKRAWRSASLSLGLGFDGRGMTPIWAAPRQSSNGSASWSGSASPWRGFRQRRGASDPGLSRPSATSRFIGETLAFAADHREGRAFFIFDAELASGVIPEVEFAEVAL